MSRRVSAKLDRELGPIRGYLAEPNVVEIITNPDGSIYVERLGSGMSHEGTIEPSRVEAVIGTLAAIHDEVVDKDQPTFGCELPDGSRFQAWTRPVSLQPCIAIRKAASQIITLAGMREGGVITQAQQDRLREFINSKSNILVVGGTGSGKTTFLNALLEEAIAQSPDARIFLVEDTREIQCRAKNLVALKSSPGTEAVDLIRTALRGRPDRIVVGEIRSGAAALEALKSWNTGHPGGLSTLHANSADSAVPRLEMLLQEEIAGNVAGLVAHAVDVIVDIRRDASRQAGRVVEKIVTVDQQPDNTYRLTKTKQECE